jgi:endonuclease/exonuclease/phosphatase (EEP) superfamily protein YafD
MNLKFFLKAFGITAIILTLVPLIAVNFWWIRVFDYPHLQLTLLTLMALLVYFIRFDVKSIGDYFFSMALVACFVFQLMKIWPYTQLAPLELLDAKTANVGSRLKIFTSNVLQKNRDWEKVVSEAHKYDPDLMVFTETDTRWADELKAAFSEAYTYQVSVPLDNTYGMIMFSRFPLQNTSVRYMVDDSIPSIHGQLKLPDGDLVQLHAIHPTPPVPQENPRSTARDAELMKVALQSRESSMPVVVLGDFNDVAWSQSTELFQQVSGLLDMRKGRGFYNTYNAENFLMRWPLDHLFISDNFRFGEMKRGGKVGSDHFPFYATIYLEPDGSKLQRKRPATDNQLKRAHREIEKTKTEE